MRARGGSRVWDLVAHLRRCQVGVPICSSPHVTKVPAATPEILNPRVQTELRIDGGFYGAEVNGIWLAEGLLGDSWVNLNGVISSL